MKEYSPSSSPVRRLRPGAKTTGVRSIRVFLAVASVILFGAIIYFPPRVIVNARARLARLFSTPPSTQEQDRVSLTIRLATLQDRYQRLLDTLQMKSIETTQFWSLRLAHVTGRNALPMAPYMLLDQGSLEGVRPGMPVVAAGGLLVGTVIEVEPHQSTLLPLTHPNSRIAATVQNEQRTIGVVQGSANLAVELLLVARSEKLNRGQLIITSGLQPLIPRGLVIGQVGSIDDDSTQVFLKATVDGFLPVERYTDLGVVVVDRHQP